MGVVAFTTGLVPPVMSTVKPAREPAGPPPLAHQPPPTWRILPGRYMTAVDVAPTGFPLAPWLAMLLGKVWASVIAPASPFAFVSRANISVPVIVKILPLP